MARAIERLTDLEVRQVKPNPNGKAKVLSDGGCLRMMVFPNGTKQWQFRINRKPGQPETTMSLGTYPLVSLADAREDAARQRKIASSGANVATVRKLENLKKKESEAVTFGAVANELLSLKKDNGISESYRQKITGAFQSNFQVKLGNVPIAQIKPALLKEVLKPVAARGSYDMLRFLVRIAGEIFDFAKSDGRYEGDNPAHALKKNVFPKHRRENMKALEWREMPGFLHRLDGFYGEFATLCCIRLILWTAVRPGEARKARWDEVDLKNGRWVIPAERMKMRQPHHVPLSKQAISMLKALKEVNGHETYLFPSKVGSKTPVLSDVAVLKAIRRTAGHNGVDAHGFRAVFRTYAGESLKWSEGVMEAALAHGKRNSVVGAYDRATHYAERKKLMQWYADELDALKIGDARAA